MNIFDLMSLVGDGWMYCFGGFNIYGGSSKYVESVGGYSSCYYFHHVVCCCSVCLLVTIGILDYSSRKFHSFFFLDMIVNSPLPFSTFYIIPDVCWSYTLPCAMCY